MDFNTLIENITPEIYQNLKRAIEIGKWPDGSKVTREQLEHSMQAVIAYEQKHLPEQERVGFIDKGHKDGDTCDSPTDDTQVITIK